MRCIGWFAMIVVVTVVGWPGGAAHGDEASPFSGYVMVFGYLDSTRALDEVGVLGHEHPDAQWFAPERLGQRLQLRINRQPTRSVSLDASLNVTYDAQSASLDPGADLGDGVSVHFKEAFVSIARARPWLDLKLGRQYVFWSRFEWGGMADVLAPWDLRNVTAEKENFRLAVDAARAWLVFEPVTLELVALPIFRPNSVSFALPGTIAGVPVIQNEARLPDRAISNAEVGARLVIEHDAGELGLSWYRGHNRNFSMRVAPQRDPVTGFPAALAFTPVYDRLQLAVADFEYAFDEVLLLGELGYAHTADPDGDDVFVKNRHLRGVIGFEWTLDEAWRIAAQAGYEQKLDYDRQGEFEARRELGQPDPFVPARWESTLAYKLQYQATSDVGLHALQLVDFFDRQTWDAMTLFFVAWAPSEGLKTYLGAIVFRGAEDTRFGRSEAEGRLFAELKHTF